MESAHLYSPMEKVGHHCHHNKVTMRTNKILSELRVILINLRIPEAVLSAKLQRHSLSQLLFTKRTKSNLKKKIIERTILNNDTFSTYILFVPYRSKQQITKAILENEFLGNLEENQVEALVDAMYPKHIPPNTLVIREGDMGKIIIFLSLY